ncbi:hypothetical protein [Actinoplanes sp. NPDC051859]|uniref:hypothetical protein n=1 Tax=Actinoplanes sp. NPDC051859 TaxID=3363909 RepID=UPI0037A14D3F
MIWPVLLTSFPRDSDWAVGERVSARVRWLDASDLPDDVTPEGRLGEAHFMAVLGTSPVTEGVVRRVRLVQDLHDRGTEEWVRRPGETRLIDLPDAGPGGLRDDPQLDEDPDLDSLEIFSPEEYFRLVRDRLPEQQWQARGFLIDLEVSAGG